jgi:methyl-accepting chemotaxis protein
MAKSQDGSTAGRDLSQPIRGGKDVPEEGLWDVLTSNLRQVMESTGAAMRILDLDFNVVVENQQMKEMGGVEAEGSEAINCYDQFCNPEVCGTENCTVNYPTLLLRRIRASVLEGGALMWTPGNQSPAIGW